MPDSEKGDDEKSNISPAVLALMRKYVYSDRTSLAIK